MEFSYFVPRCMRPVAAVPAARPRFHGARISSALLVCLWLQGMSAFVAPPAEAMTQNDLLIAGRALGFLAKPPTGEITVGIVYVAANPQSVLEADELQKMLAGGLKVGNVTLKPLRVSPTEAAGADVQLFLLTTGVGSEGARVGQAAKKKHILCVTIDIDQVRSGNCAMAVRSAPKIEILVNRAAAAESNISFATVFLMMITEF